MNSQWLFHVMSFSERSAGKTVTDSKMRCKKNELELHFFEEEYEKVSTVFTDGMTVRDARMTRTKRDVE